MKEMWRQRRWLVWLLVLPLGMAQLLFAQDKTKRRTKKDAVKHDFEGIGVSGARKTPLSSLISKSKANKDYDFVKIRRSWHPEMIQSTTSLDSSSKQKP
ncbi:MAG: hypothetical protein OXT67_00355 [Zetaproteobacteria bacterium]|nr:hypothetical protein [Zetaproteobacteria bacterium]